MPAIADVSNYGVLVNPRPRRRDTPMTDRCDATPSLQLPFGVHPPDAAIDAWLRAGWVPTDESGFEGPEVILPNIPLVRSSLPASANGDQARFVILTSIGCACCGTGGRPDVAREESRAIAALNADGIKTLVVGFTLGSPTTRGNIQYMANLAVAGGLARTDGHLSENTNPDEFPFVDGTDLNRYREAINTRILPTYYCRGTVALEDRSAIDEVVAQQSDGVAVPRDGTHRDGWDWIDRARQRIEVFGPACTRVVEGRLGVRFLTPGRLCVQ